MHIESFFSIFETQLLKDWFSKSMSDEFEKVVNFIEFYNNDLLNGSIDYNFPKKFKNKYKLGEYQDYQVSA